MDSLTAAAARALARGDPFGALNRVALREDPPALALRGIAMAQLGDLDRARKLLRRAARSFGVREAAERARCVVAEAEVALVSRDLAWPAAALEAARRTLEARGDRANAAHARALAARRLLLLGRVEAAEAEIDAIDPGAGLAPATRAACDLVRAGIAIRRLRSIPAGKALAAAATAAREAGIPSLAAEVDRAVQVLAAPMARLALPEGDRLLGLAEVEALLGDGGLVVDACRGAVRRDGHLVALERRPVLFALVRTLADAWPGEATRAELLRRAFRARHVDESHRARLRVEIGRLRAVLAGLASVSATKAGFRLAPAGGGTLSLLLPLTEDAHPEVLALLADGETWSSSALALALGESQRSVQRALRVLATAGRVEALGEGRARRWMTPPVPGFPTAMLLPAPVRGG